MIFFCRGVLETLQMLGWSPDIIHCHGWFTSLLPLYLKKLHFEHPVFNQTKIISSIHKHGGFKKTLNNQLLEKIKFDGINDEYLNKLSKPNCDNLYALAAKFSDGVILEDGYSNSSIVRSLYNDNTPILETSKEYAEYYDFYQNFFSEELV